MEYAMKVTLRNLPMIIYVNNNSMAIILSLKEVENYFCMTMNNDEDRTMLVNFNKDKA